MTDRSRPWAPDLVAGGAVFLLGVLLWWLLGGWGVGGILILGLTAAAVALCRREPGAALAIAWFTLLAHLGLGLAFGIIELGFLVVAFGIARWGSRRVVIASAVSILLAGALLVVAVANQPGVIYDQFPFLRELVFTGRIGIPGRVGAAALGAVALGGPWLLGLAMRFADRARVSETEQERAEERAELALLETAQAHEIARLQEESARLARDVHDVVGHSLAVILAQAESGQYLPDDDPARLKATLATIAGSARGSLRDVRAVLTPTEATQVIAQSYEALLDGIRTGGREVVAHELGTPRPLPPEIEATAYRTVQEMLTNAVKYGRRDAPIVVERLWPDHTFAGELRLEVSNGVDPAMQTSEGGRGLVGMRQRLEAVDGRLDVRRREGADATTFTVTAWLPVSRRGTAR